MAGTLAANPAESAHTTTPAAGQVLTVDAATLAQWVGRSEAVVVDVREPDEHARERITGTTLVPLSRFAASALPVAEGRKLVLHCKSGKRSADAARAAAAAGLTVYTLTGGIEAWKQAGLATDTSGKAPAISIMRQVQLVVGISVLTGSALAWLVHPAFIAVPAFFGAGLTFAGASGTCALASVLGAMPWNRISTGNCQGGTCCG